MPVAIGLVVIGLIIAIVIVTIKGIISSVTKNKRSRTTQDYTQMRSDTKEVNKYT